MSRSPNWMVVKLQSNALQELRASVIILQIFVKLEMQLQRQLKAHLSLPSSVPHPDGKTNRKQGFFKPQTADLSPRLLVKGK